MAKENDNSPPPVRRFPDGISCAGALLLITLILVAVGAGLGSAKGSDTPIQTRTVQAKGFVSLAEFVTPESLAEHESTTEAQVDSPALPSATAWEPSNRQTTATPLAPLELTESLPLDIEQLQFDDQVTRPAPLPTPFENYSFTLKVPILMYHYISQPPDDADEYRLDLSTTPDNFRAQLQFLVDNGYETIDLYDLSLAIVDKIDLPEKPVIITLDDGYRDNYEYAFPILEEFGFEATFFVVTEFVDQGNSNYMDWAMIEEMAKAGNRIEPHSKTHPDLTRHDRDFVIWEVLGSAETISAHVGYRPRYFAYPGGRYDDDVKELVAELDFWGAVTTEDGLWHGFEDRFNWPRIRIRLTTAIEEFSNLLD
jgi:peptidoglycan/xylan/chitin deacetylase (PgdA/CDA1 family)